MRIIHFSDFHLRADHLERAESIIKRLKEALRTISEERKSKRPKMTYCLKP